MKQIIGCLLIASPFVAITAFAVIEDGWQAALIAWAGVFLIFGVVMLGLHLLMGD